MITKAATLSIFSSLAWHDYCSPVLAGAWCDLRPYTLLRQDTSYLSVQALSTNCSYMPGYCWQRAIKVTCLPFASTQIGQTTSGLCPTGPRWQKCKCKRLFAVKITAVCVQVNEIPLFNGQIAKTDPTHNGGFMVSRLAD